MTQFAKELEVIDLLSFTVSTLSSGARKIAAELNDIVWVEWVQERLF